MCVSLSSHFVILLCLGSPFYSPQVHSSCCFWCLPPVSEVGSVACVGFLVEGTGACVLVGEAGPSFLWAGPGLVVCFGVPVNLV